MNNQVAERKKPDPAIDQLPEKQFSLIKSMATKFDMDPALYAATVKKTAMPANATNEQFAAFMMVCKQYDLNPLLKEIYAFPAKGGGIVPMVSIDGWVNIINSNPMLNGFEFIMEYDEKDQLVACTCKMWRKDRQLPVIVTEYLREVQRNTEPWKMKHRMLRHKSLIQTARYCFGLAGIYDEDEANDILANMKDVTPPRPTEQEFRIPAVVARGTKQQDDDQEQQQQPNEQQGETPAAATNTDEAQVETVNRETGEINTEFGSKHAKELGMEWRKNKRARAIMPPHFPTEDEKLVEAFQAGWDEQDAAMAKEAKRDGGAK